MQTKIGLAIKRWTELFFLRASGDSSSQTCNELVDALAELDANFLILGRRLDSIERQILILAGSEPGKTSEESSI